MHVVRRRLEVPRHLPGLDVHRDQRAREQVVSLAARAGRVRRRRIARAEDVELRIRIVRAGDPRLRAAVPRRVETTPRIEPRIALLHRHRVELPLQLTGLGIERLQEAGRVDVVARPHQHMIADHDRRRRREVTLVEVGDRLVPALLPRLRVERYQVIVGRLHVEVVVPHGEAAVADVRAAARFPEVVPQLAPVMRVDRPRVVGHREVECAVDEQDRALDRAAARREIARAFSAHDDRRLRSAEAAASAAPAAGRVPGPRREPRRPREGEVLDRRAIHLRERAEPLAAVIAVVARPLVLQRLQQLRGLDAAALRAQQSGQQQHRKEVSRSHFRVTR
jgi:hypothetical protein